ncbi:MAG: hypothetical protein ACOYK6_05685 [Chthoniobacterales bacterium]
MSVDELYQRTLECANMANKASTSVLNARSQGNSKAIRAAEVLLKEAQEEYKVAQKICVRLSKISAASPDDEDLKTYLKDARDNLAAAHADLTDVSHPSTTWSNTSSTNNNYPRTGLTISSARGGTSGHESLKGPPAVDVMGQESTEKDGNTSTRKGNLKGPPADNNDSLADHVDFESNFKKAHAEVLQQIKEEEDAQKVFEERRNAAEQVAIEKQAAKQKKEEEKRQQEIQRQSGNIRWKF